MEIRMLRYFLTVAREQCITKAAEVLHITQPTLSRQLAQMEAEMGVKLFSRESHRLSLTDEGFLLRRRAEEILELVDKTEKELAEQEEAVEGTVSVGCGDLGAVQILPALFRDFHERYPAVTFELYTATADYVEERMERGLTDIGLLMEPIDMERLDFIRLNRRERWVVAMHPDSPLAQKDRVTAQDLKDVPLILPYRRNVQSELANWFGDCYESLNVLFTSNLPAAGSVMVYSRLAYLLMIEGTGMLWDKEKLICRPLYPELTATSVLAWKRQQPFTPAAARFIAYMREAIGAEAGERR